MVWKLLRARKPQVLASWTKTSSQREFKGGDSVLRGPDSLLALELRAAEWGYTALLVTGSDTGPVHVTKGWKTV